VRAHQRVTQAGPGNQQVREYLELRRSRGGRSPTRAAIEGLGLIDAALTHGATIEVALACPALLRGTRADGVVARLAAAGVPMLQVSERTFERLTARDGPDGLAAIVRVRTVPLHEVAVGGVARALVRAPIGALGTGPGSRSCSARSDTAWPPSGGTGPTSCSPSRWPGGWTR